tara:strand:- start:1319 stop:2137 length:819 start_codon:yes stop_codon:yes gene_type:complete
MNPIDQAFLFLKAPRDNIDLHRRIAEITRDVPDDIENYEDLIDWKRFAHAQSSNRLIPDIERKYPSLRHTRERKIQLEDDRQDELREAADRDFKDKEIQELEDFRLRPFGQPGQTIRDNMFSLRHSPDLRISRPTNVERELRHFRHSNRGIELAEQLQEQQRQNKINRLIGVSPQKFGSSSNMEEELLLHALKTGDAGPLERFQQPTHGSMIGDMPLQQYEQVYPTMPTPELQASSVIPDSRFYQSNKYGFEPDIFDTVNQRKYGEYEGVYD